MTHWLTAEMPFPIIFLSSELWVETEMREHFETREHDTDFRFLSTEQASAYLDLC